MKLTSILAPALVLVGGFAIGRYVSRPAPPPPLPPPTCPEIATPPLEIACLPLMRRTAQSLDRAQTRVSALQLQVRDKLDEVQQLEAKVLNSGSAAPNAQAKLIYARDQLSSLEVALTQAKTDKEAVLLDLESTREALQGTREALEAAQARTRAAEEEAAVQHWERFVGDAQLTICAHGNKVNMDRCRERVARTLLPYALRYKSCVRSHQAIPELRSSKSGDPLPRFGVTLPLAGETSTWFILFCDPALPEAHAPGASSP